jgi:hypothetical protein
MNSSRSQRVLRIVAFASVGFFSSIQPSEAYLTKILLAKGLTEEELDGQVWPADTYASLCFMLLVTIMSDLLGQRTVIGLGLIGWQVVCALLAFASSVPAQMAMQVAYAFTTSARVVYLAHVYAVFLECDFAAATTAAIAGHHLGSVLGSALGQALVSNVPAIARDLSLLVFVSWTFVLVGLVLFIAAAPRALRPQQMSFVRVLWINGVRRSVNQVRATVSKSGAEWLTWWVPTMASLLIFGNYFQAVLSHFKDVAFGSLSVAIEIGAVAGSFTPVVVSKLKCGRGEKFHTSLVAVSSVVTGALMVLMGVTDNVIVCAACAVLVYALFGGQEATANWSVAGDDKESRPSLVFGLATFAALVLASVVQVAVSASALNSRQYMYVCATLYFSVPFFQATARVVRLVAATRKLKDKDGDGDDTEEEEEETETLEVPLIVAEA